MKVSSYLGLTLWWMQHSKYGSLKSMVHQLVLSKYCGRDDGEGGGARREVGVRTIWVWLHGCGHGGR